MPTPSMETARAWLGRVVVDRDGDKLGEVTDIYLDNETGRPEWAVVRTGLFGLRSSFVPLAEATQDGDQIQVPYQKATVKGAPNIAPDGQLSQAEETELYRHYGLAYDPGMADSDPPADETHIGPAAQPAGPGIEEPADAPTGEPADTGAHRTGPYGPAAQDRSPVGEATSRPFVYEIPSGPESGSGTSRREHGQVRLRKYVVTEVVTETATGQRHELRVEGEPIGDADAMTDIPSPSGEPVAEEQTGPDDNDWFRAEHDPRH